jgi:hypothetical protein
MIPHNRPITGRGWLATRQPRVFAGAQPSGISVRIQTDTRSNLYKPIRVTPEQAQTLQWITPGNVVRYEIVTTLDWRIE